MGSADSDSFVFEKVRAYVYMIGFMCDIQNQIGQKKQFSANSFET